MSAAEPFAAPARPGDAAGPPPRGADPSREPHEASTLQGRALFCYGALRAPLALLELPLFVMLPAFYGREAGLSLALVGLVLFAARALDAIADPLLGAWIDRTRAQRDYRGWIVLALAPLAFGFVALLHPPEGASSLLLAGWLAGLSTLTYLAWSTVTIAHQAWGAELGSDEATRVRVTGWREACGLGGVLLSAILLEPSLATALSVMFVVMLILAALALHRAPLPRRSPGRARPSSPARPGSKPWSLIARDRQFAQLLVIFMFNGVASAIPATLVLFFVADILGLPGEAGLFLLVYFIAAALGMPAWVALGARLGARRAWLCGMVMAVAAFGWAFGLGAGDVMAFGVICAVTGFALGADLAMPSALLASVIAGAGGRGEQEGSYFGMWALATKLNLALAAGLGLPLLGALGYAPGAPSSLWALSSAYALVPCVFKLIAVAVLWRATRFDCSKDVISS